MFHTTVPRLPRPRGSPGQGVEPLADVVFVRLCTRTLAVYHPSQFEDLQLHLLTSSVVLAMRTVQWPVFPDPLLAKNSSSQAESGLTLTHCLFLLFFVCLLFLCLLFGSRSIDWTKPPSVAAVLLVFAITVQSLSQDHFLSLQHLRPEAPVTVTLRLAS